jgi:hypothetical protein
MKHIYVVYFKTTLNLICVFLYADEAKFFCEERNELIKKEVSENYAHYPHGSFVSMTLDKHKLLINFDKDGYTDCLFGYIALEVNSMFA